MGEKRKFRDQPLGKRIAIVVLGTFQVGLSIATLVDLHRRTPEQVNGSKRWWRLAAFTNTVGPVAYFVFGRKR
jgi:hypothetical protein